MRPLFSWVLKVLNIPLLDFSKGESIQPLLAVAGQKGAVIVCTLTGHGLKDPDTAIAQSGKPTAVEATREAIEKIIAANMPK